MTEASKSLPRIGDRLRRLCALTLATFSLASLASVGTADSVSAEPAPRSPVTATGAGGRSGTVSPGVDLSNEVINISWSGFRPTTQQNIYTKNNNDAMKSQCINTAEIEDKNYQSK